MTEPAFAKYAPYLARPVNWNRLDDELDLTVWNKLTSQFWLPEAIAMSNDIASWSSLTEAQQTMTMRAFAGLTLLDTIQGTVGAVALIPDSITQHEEAVYTFIAMQESVHAKSYSQIFSTLASTKQIDEVFEWSENNEHLQAKARIILEKYNSRYVPGMSGFDHQIAMKVALRRKAASTLLESFLFYSGFYLPLYWASHSQLANTADMIRLIIRDEAVHGYYIGYKFQKTFAKLTPENQVEIRMWVYDFMLELMDNEEDYTRDVYVGSGLETDVFGFLRYNANKALMNLGFEALFQAEDCQFSPGVKGGLSLDSENFDFFSGAGSSYIIGKVEATADDDWEF